MEAFETSSGTTLRNAFDNVLSLFILILNIKPPSTASISLQIQYIPQHLVRLLQIIVDGNCDMGVRQVASIHFKNFIGKNWLPHEPDEQNKISQADKDVVREHVLVFVTQVPPLLRVQLGEFLKTIIYVDYPERWPRLLD